MTVRHGIVLGITALLAVTALLVGSLGSAMDTPADGDHSLASTLTTRGLLLDAVRAGDRLVAVGERGHVLLSDDGGESWRQARFVPTRATLTGVVFVDAERGWAVGHDAVVIHSNDGGETWALQHAAPEEESPLLAVWFEDERHGLAVGAFSLTLETTDGGITWNKRSLIEGSEMDYHLNDLFQGPAATVFIAAEVGNVYRSRDAGATWENLEPGYEGSFWSGIGLGAESLLVFGMRGHIFRSEDLGETWNEVESQTEQSLQAGTRLEDGGLVLVGLGGAILSSRDEGRQFSETIQPNRRGLASVIEGSPGRVLLFGESGIDEPETPLP